MDSLLRDLKFSARSLLKRPALSLVAIITLAVGIGATSAIFSVVNALIIKPLPFPDLDRIVAVWEKVPSRGVERNEASMANYLDWRTQNQTFEHLGLIRWWSTNLTGVDQPERLQGFLVTPNFLEVVGVKPLLGRGFSAEEEEQGKDAVVLLTYGLWQRRFGGDPNILNKTIAIDGASRTVIGVMPQGFNYPKGAELYAPLAISPELRRSRQSYSYLAIGRLKRGVSIAGAQADLDTIATRLEQQYPKTNTGRGVAIYPIVADTVRMYATATWVLMGTVGFVLLIACANVGNLMLARAADRQREFSLRSALGAGRWRIVRQLLTESLLLAVAGGGLGVLVAYWTVDLIRVANPGEASKFAPGWDHLGINLPVLGFTLLVSLLSGLFFGLAPAWQASKTDLNQVMKESTRQASSRSHRLRGLLVISEVALSLMLLVGAGLLMRSFLSLLKTNAGFNPDNVLTMNLVLPSSKYKDEPQRSSFYAELVRRVNAMPGVESAAAVNYLPLGGSNSSDSFLIEGRPDPPPGQEFMGRYRVCTPDYFRTMEIPVVKGRGFTEQDHAGTQPVIVVNQTLARKFWPDQDPIGKRMRFSGPIEKNAWMEVVGVVRDVKYDLNLPVTEEYYLPHAQRSWSAMVLVARTKVDPLALGAAMRQEVWSIDKDQPVFDVRTMQQVRAISVALYSFSSVSLGIFACVALFLATIGIYGVMSYAVTQRTQEIGIRMALGAQGRDVLRLMVKSGMRLAIIGVVFGLALTWGLTRFIASLLVGVNPTDTLTLSAVSICLLLIGFLACYVPARRATRVDPLEALRYE